MEDRVARVYMFKKVLKYSILSLLIAIVGLLVFEYFRIKPNNVYFTNITSSSITVSWDTKVKTDATAIYVDKDNKLPFIILPVFKDRFFDTRDITKAELKAAAQSSQNQGGLEVTMNDMVTNVSVTDRGKYYTHHVEIKGLEPETEYSFMVGDSIVFRKVKDVNNETIAKTYAVPESILTPYPAYGNVSDANNENIPVDKLIPLIDGIVYFDFYDNSTGIRSNVYSSPLNEMGNWYIDVSNSVDYVGNDFFATYDSIEENLTAELYINTGPMGLWKKTMSAYSFSPASQTVLNVPDGIGDETINGSIVKIETLVNDQQVKGALIAIACDCPDCCSGAYPYSSCPKDKECDSKLVSCTPNDACGEPTCGTITSTCYKLKESPSTCDGACTSCPSGTHTSCPDGKECSTQSTACNPASCGSHTCYKVTGDIDECTGCSCTPACPAGYDKKKPSNGTYETKSVNCDREDSCGEACGGKTYLNCYKSTTNSNATKVSCSFPVYCPATVKDCVWKWSDGTYHDSCDCDEDIMKVRNCKSVMNPEDISCAGGGTLNTCIYSSSEAICKRCEAYEYSAESLDGRWMPVNISLCGGNTSQSPRNCSDSSPQSCSVCSSTDKYVRTSWKLPSGMTCSNNNQNSINAYGINNSKDCSCTIGSKTNNYSSYVTECEDPELKTCRACSLRFKYKEQIWTAKDCTDTTERPTTNMENELNCTCTNAPESFESDARACSNEIIACQGCSLRYSNVYETWYAPAGVSCHNAQLASQVTKNLTKNCNCTIGTENFNNYSQQCQYNADQHCWQYKTLTIGSQMSNFSKCDGSSCYRCIDGTWKLEKKVNESTEHNLYSCLQLSQTNENNAACYSIGTYCSSNNIIFKCVGYVWKKVTDDNEKTPVSEGTPISQGSQCHTNGCYCTSGPDEGEPIKINQWCREVEGHASCEKGGQVCNTQEKKKVCYNPFESEPDNPNFQWYCIVEQKQSNLLPTEKSKNSNISSILKITSDIFAEESSNTSRTYLLDQSTGLIANLESGLYTFDINGQTYSFVVQGDGINNEILLYIDVDENGQYDEDTDTKVSTLASQIEITTIQKNYKFNLKQGFNFVSFPFVVAYDEYKTAAALLKQLNDVYGDVIYSISRFDGAWKVVGQNVELYDNNDFQLLPGQGYVIKAKENVDIVIPGKPIKYESAQDSAPVSLFPGWNLIGIYGNNVKTYTAKSMLQDINAYEPVDFTANNVSKWESDTQKYDGFQLEVESGVEMEYGFDYTIDILKSYFVKVESGEGNWQPKLAE